MLVALQNARACCRPAPEAYSGIEPTLEMFIAAPLQLGVIPIIFFKSLYQARLEGLT
jgi:hypothetical protein